MKKYFLLISGSLIFMSQSYAMTADQQLGMMKDMYLKEFQKMDTDKDGLVSKDEYLRFQFENFRANIIEAEGFDNVKENKTLDSQPVEKNPQSPAENLDKAMNALEEMANFKLDDEEDGILEENTETKVAEEPQKLTLEDVMPEKEIDFSSLADDNLDEILAPDDKKIEPETVEKAEEKIPSKEEQLAPLMETIRKTLPKKIDEVTTWTDILYKDDMIQYVYVADLDLATMSAEEKKILEDSIQTETCPNVYKDMCPKVKPIFIDKSIDMRINYVDKNQQQFSYCEFNEKTCE